MKKIITVIASILISLLIISKILSWTNILSSYQVMSGAMSPSMEMGNHYLISKLIKPKIGDVICYRAIYEKDGLEHTFNHRLMALENDTIEMKNGLCYRNGICIDDSMKLKFMYEVTNRDLIQIKKVCEISDNDLSVLNDSILYIALTYNQMNKVKQYSKRVSSIINKTEKKPNLFYSSKNDSWNADFIGPLIVPKGYCFVLGDNRHKSQDSRYRDFIPIEKIVGVMFYRYR